MLINIDSQVFYIYSFGSMLSSFIIGWSLGDKINIYKLLIHNKFKVMQIYTSKKRWYHQQGSALKVYQYSQVSHKHNVKIKVGLKFNLEVFIFPFFILFYSKSV